MPGYNVNDPDGHVMIRVGKSHFTVFVLSDIRADQLKRRLNRRLAKLAKWVDIPAEERQIEFRSSRSFAPPTASFGFPYSSTMNSVHKPADQFSTYDSTSFAPVPPQKPTSTAHLAHLLSQPVNATAAAIMAGVKADLAPPPSNPATEAVAAEAPKDEFEFEIEELSPEEIAANKKE